MQLPYGGRSLNVGRHKEYALAVGTELFRQLGGGCGFAGSLQASQDDPPRLRTGKVQRCGRPKRGGELFADDFDHLLGGIQCAGDFAPGRADPDSGKEIPHDGEVHIRLQQRQTHLAQSRIRIRLAQHAAPRKRVEDFL
jgi:hypothetical protein